MAYSLRKMWAAMAVSLVAATSFVGADYYDNQYDTSGCCPCGPVRPVVDACGNWFISADAIFWKPCEDGLTYGSRTAVATTDGLIASNTHVRNLDPKWDVGFRIGLGYNTACDGWDVVAYWTRFKTHTNKRVLHPTDILTDTFAPAWGSALDIADATRARWHLDLNIADVELGREFCVSSCVTLRPFVGVRGAWVHQRYDIVSLIGDLDVQVVRLKSNFDGAGLRGGFDTEWKLGMCGFSIYGQAAASVIYGEYHVDFDQVVAQTIIRQRDRFCACRAITDGALGLRWKQFFSCDTIALTLQLGYEHHMFFNQNRFENSIVATGRRNPQISRGDLCTQGVTLSAKVDF